jgi:hypothetical protein
MHLYPPPREFLNSHPMVASGDPDVVRPENRPFLRPGRYRSRLTATGDVLSPAPPGQSTPWRLQCQRVVNDARFDPLAAIAAADTNWAAMSAAQRAGFDPIGQSLLGVPNFADVPVGVLGVLMITGEYTTGMIRAVFCAVPRRLPVVWWRARRWGHARRLAERMACGRRGGRSCCSPSFLALTGWALRAAERMG